MTQHSPPRGWLRLRFAPTGGRRFWVEPYLHAAARQERLSTLDLGDKSYRGISWGLDAPGRGAYVRYSLRF